MESTANLVKEAEAFGNQAPAPPYVVTVPRSALGMQPPVYYETPGQKWSWCNVVTSVISLFFCFCCGVVATVMAMASYTDHKARDFARSQKKRTWAYGLAITAIVIGSIFLIGYIVMVARFIRMGVDFDRYGMGDHHGRDRFD